jgi:hypothetical protein
MKPASLGGILVERRHYRAELGGNATTHPIDGLRWRKQAFVDYITQGKGGWIGFRCPENLFVE